MPEQHITVATEARVRWPSLVLVGAIRLVRGHLLPPVVCLLVPYWALRYLGHFPEDAAAAITLVSNLLCFVIYRDVMERTDGFRAFRFHVDPNWETLLSDYKVVTTEADWKSLRERTRAWSDSEYHLLWDGLTFTILRPDTIFWDDKKAFKTTADFRIQMEPLEFIDQSGTVKAPIFYLRENGIGYEFGLITPESYCRYPNWSDEAPMRVPVAVLPYEALDTYWKRTTPWVRKLAGIPTLEDSGWSLTDGDTAQHKYITIRHRAI